MTAGQDRSVPEPAYPAETVDSTAPAGPAPSPAVRRPLPAIGGIGVLDRLAALSGSDFISLMLEVARRRAASETPASVLRRYRPGPV
jgi:hypothetical protein